jgi:hypothetical protein
MVYLRTKKPSLKLLRLYEDRTLRIECTMGRQHEMSKS